MARSVSVAVVGAGFGGIAAAIAAKQQGVEDLVVLERSDAIGGVWRANTYPGAACDVPSHLYSFSFAPNPRWSRRFSPGPEIRGYLREVADRFDVTRHVRLKQEVARAIWDEGAGRWLLEVHGGPDVEADVLVAACGQLSEPKIPGLVGLERFAGPMFHSAHWDHDAPLDGARVAVIGTGASVIQFVPAIAERTARLTVFQRSAPWIIPKNDKALDRSTQRLYAHVPALPRAARTGWWAFMEAIVPVFTRTPPRTATTMERFFRALAGVQRFVQLRGDRELIAKTTPSDPVGCKRTLLTDDWYPTLRRDDVELVTEPIREVVADGVVDATGRHHGADVLIFGTGFDASGFVAPMDVVGRDGLRLAEAWSAGAEAYLGMAVPRFPNLFLLYGPNTNHGTGSVLAMHEAQAGYIGDALRRLIAGEAERLEVRRDVHDRFQAELSDRLARSVWVGGCSSWYITESGRVTNNWPGSQTEYRRRTRALDPADYLTEAPVAA